MGEKSFPEPVCLGPEAPVSPPRVQEGGERMVRVREVLYDIVCSSETMLPVNVLNVSLGLDIPSEFDFILYLHTEQYIILCYVYSYVHGITQGCVLGPRRS